MYTPPQLHSVHSSILLSLSVHDVTSIAVVRLLVLQVLQVLSPGAELSGAPHIISFTIAPPTAKTNALPKAVMRTHMNQYKTAVMLSAKTPVKKPVSR